MEATASYGDTKNIPAHSLALDALPDVIRISGVVSEVIWTINARKPLGTRFSLELQVAEDWIAIEEIGEETVQIEPSVEMNFQARLVAISPFRTRRTSINAPVGIIDFGRIRKRNISGVVATLNSYSDFLHSELQFSLFCGSMSAASDFAPELSVACAIR